MENRLWLLLGLLALAWGGSFMAYEIALTSISVSTVVMYRVVVGAVIMWGLALLNGWKIPRGRIWFDYIIMGFLGLALPFYLIAYGQQFIDSGLASILNAATAIFGALLAPIFMTSERFSTMKFIGVILGFIGVVYAIGWSFISEFSLSGIGQIAGIGAAISYAIAGVYTKLRSSGNGRTDTLGMLTTSGIMLIALRFFIDTSGNLIPDVNGIIACIYLALISTVCAYLLFFAILKIGDASFVLLVTLLVPPISIFLGAIFLGERLGMNAYIGFAILALALVIIDGRLIKAILGYK